MHQVLCSTGALIGRPNGRDFRLIPSCVNQLNCDGYEFMMYDSWYDQEEEVVRMMQSLSVPIPVVHCEKGIGELLGRDASGDWPQAQRRFERNCRIAQRLGADRLVMHLWNGLLSDRYIEKNIAAYDSLRQLAERHGLDLLIENVVCNQRDPMTHWRALNRQHPDVHFVFDTKMAAFHGQLEAMYTQENRALWEKKQIRHLHINDYRGGYMDWDHLKTLHVGKGDVDFREFFSFLKRVNYSGDFTVEATSFDQQGRIHCQELNESIERVRAYWQEKEQSNG